LQSGFCRQASCADNAAKAGNATTLDKDALFASAFALFLDPPIGVMTDAAGLANNQIGSSEGRIDAV
jgi:hypothetical protein